MNTGHTGSVPSTTTTTTQKHMLKCYTYYYTTITTTTNHVPRCNKFVSGKISAETQLGEFMTPRGPPTTSMPATSGVAGFFGSKLSCAWVPAMEWNMLQGWVMHGVATSHSHGPHYRTGKSNRDIDKRKTALTTTIHSTSNAEKLVNMCSQTTKFCWLISNHPSLTLHLLYMHMTMHLHSGHVTLLRTKFILLNCPPIGFTTPGGLTLGSASYF